MNRRRAALREGQIVDTRRQDRHLVLRIAGSRREQQESQKKYEPRWLDVHKASDFFVSVVTFVVGF
jgi:hypothetical protein